MQLHGLAFQACFGLIGEIYSSLFLILQWPTKIQL